MVEIEEIDSQPGELGSNLSYLHNSYSGAAAASLMSWTSWPEGDPPRQNSSPFKFTGQATGWILFQISLLGYSLEHAIMQVCLQIPSRFAHYADHKFGSHGKELPPGKRRPQTNNTQQGHVKLGNQTK